ncbi:MAG TPA: cupin domain-containing protein [Dehalococcoidia bacterium]
MVVRIAKDTLRGDAGQNAAMERTIAVSRDTVGSRGIYSSIVTTAPGGRTEIHHHGECETSIYILRGIARFYSGEGLGDIVEAYEGDFVYVPAHEVHVEENASNTDDLVVLLSRNCDGSVVHYVDGKLPDRPG